MTINLETLRAELHAEIEKLHDEIDRRCDAATQKKADVEPPMLTEYEWEMLEKEYHPSIPNSMNRMQCNAADRLRYVEAELARLREGLKVQGSDLPDSRLVPWTASELYDTEGARMAREIQRHRRLVQP